MHLPLARSMSVIFCLRPRSSIVILVFYLFFYRHQGTACVRTVSVNSIQFTGLTHPLWGTPVNLIYKIRRILTTPRRLLLQAARIVGRLVGLTYFAAVAATAAICIREPWSDGRRCIIVQWPAQRFPYDRPKAS